MSSALDTLLEMGFPRNRAEKAILVTGNQGAESAMEWLLVHSDDPRIDEPLETVGSSNLPAEKEDVTKSDEVSNTEEKVSQAAEENSSTLQPENVSNSVPEARSVQCDECGKLFKSEVEIEFHAAKTGHQSFSESTEEVQPLTEEEKREQIKKLEEKIKQRRMAKEEENRKEQIEKEKVRRRTGQEIIEAKKRLEEEEMRRIAEQRRKEKMEDKLARQRVLEQIERDKQARKEKFGAAGQTTVASPIAGAVVQPAETTEIVEKKEYPQARLQIRLTNGQTLTQSFGSKEELAAVRLYIEMNRTDGSGPFTLMTSFPKKVFTEDDMEKPLYQLGLVPSAVLILSKANNA